MPSTTFATTSARQLVRHYERSGHMGRELLRRAIALAQAKDQLQLACDPQTLEPNRPFAILPQDHPLAWVLAQTYEASQHDGWEHVAAPMQGRLEEALGCRIYTTPAIKTLSRLGLVIVDQINGIAVPLRATNPALASRINALRLRTPKSGYDRYLLVRAVLGLAQRPQKLRTETLYQAAEWLDRYDINASDLLSDKRRVHPVSRWHIEQKDAPRHQM